MTSSFIEPYNHEEADTRVFLHNNDMSLQSHSKVVIRTVDADVLLLAVSAFAHLKEQLKELWVDFGEGEHRKYLVIHVFSIILVNEEHANSCSSMHLLYATKCLFYHLLQRD